MHLEKIYLVHKYHRNRRPNAFCAGDAENRIVGLSLRKLHEKTIKNSSKQRK